MNKTLTLSIVVALIVGGVVGYFVGSLSGFEKGKTTQQEKLGGLVDLVFPKPPEMIRSASGIITAVNGSSLSLEIGDPEDYLPHTDGTQQKKVVRTATLTPSTKILLIDSTQIDAQGNPKITELSATDLKVGDAVTVRTDKNIRTETSFDAQQIEMVKY